jgi:hypothetical protein
MSLLWKVTFVEKSQWTLRDSQILAATEEEDIGQGCRAVGKEPKPMPGPEKVHVAVLQLAENNNNRMV